MGECLEFICNCFLMAIKALIEVKRRGQFENRLAASVKAGSAR